jgi:hypothetical protein
VLLRLCSSEVSAIVELSFSYPDYWLSMSSLLAECAIPIRDVSRLSLDDSLSPLL